MPSIKEIRDIPIEEIFSFLKENGEKPFRAKQINEWLWKKGATSFDEMSDLSKELRNKLQNSFVFKRAIIQQEMQSKDKSVKFSFLLHDGKMVEGVLIPSRDRVTACISSQVGCALGCRFCATGSMGFTRNLHYSEIFDQFILMNGRSQNIYGRTIGNIVFMGMGEPLLNYSNVIRSIKLFTDPKLLAMSSSRITLSTSGITKEIKKLADDDIEAGLAISLHSADEQVRRALMPVAVPNSLDDLKEALQYYVKKKKQRITFEYILFKNINDSLEDAKKLAHYCRAFPVKINLIPYNNTGSSFKSSDEETIAVFRDYLEGKNMIVNIRKSKGDDIAAACGQLIKNNSSLKK